MYIKSVDITNYKIFSDKFTMDFNIPDSENIGSGLTVLCGENGNGKSSILEAIGFATQDYRSDNFSIENINDLTKDSEIKLNTASFPVKTVLPGGVTFNATGFEFKAHKRIRTNGDLYGSLIVSGRKIIPQLNTTKDYELRCEGTNPWGQQRYQQPFVLFLDKNRIYQTRKGSSTSTNFDYLLQRLSLDDNTADSENTNYELSEEHPLNKAFTKFEQLFGIPLKLYRKNPVNPMENAFVASCTEKNIIKLNNLGSGYEMFFAILWAIERSSIDSRELIILLDEPELHLHPKMQEILIRLLVNISKNVQVIIATHSPLFIKQLSTDPTKFHILQKNEGVPTIQGMKEQKINGFLSLNEINFMAFNLYTEEYFNELYETLYNQERDSDSSIRINNFDEKFFITKKNLQATKPNHAVTSTGLVSIITFIRNVIHHRVEYKGAGLNYTPEELKDAIDTMRDYL